MDDLHGLSPTLRLAAQITASTLLWTSGYRVPLVENPLMNMALTVLFVVCFVNAFNFLDGIDGLAAGTAAILAIGYGTICDIAISPAGLVAAWSLAGACLAFLAYNFPPASIFMGDSGSTLLGFSIAVMGLDLYRGVNSQPGSIAFPILIAAIPLLDAGLAVLRRLQRHVSVASGDRRHLYDLLLARGMTPRGVVLLFYALTTGLVCAGWVSLKAGPHAGLLLAATCWGVLGIWAVHLGALRWTHDANPARARTAFEQ
jgi:UDP-GlcNAc:undecaprenyl-phosphate GlcNAc-1-phosphate transferase